MEADFAIAGSLVSSLDKGVIGECRTVGRSLRREFSSALALIAGVMLWASSKPPIVSQSLTTPPGGAAAAAAGDPVRSFNSGIPNAVAIKATPNSQGNFPLAHDGKVYGYGDAVSLGDAHLAHAPVTMAVTKDAKGYWVFDTGTTATQLIRLVRRARTVP